MIQKRWQSSFCQFGRFVNEQNCRRCIIIIIRPQILHGRCAVLERQYSCDTMHVLLRIFYFANMASYTGKKKTDMFEVKRSTKHVVANVT